MRSLQEIITRYPKATDHGLSEAEVADSRSRFGSNRLTPLPRVPAWQKFLEKFDEPIIKILLAASLLKIVVDLFEASVPAGLAMLVVVLVVGIAGWVWQRLAPWLPSLFFGLACVGVVVSVIQGHPSYEGLAVMVAVILATGVSFLSEYRSDREFEKLNAARESVMVKVVRNGTVHALPLEEIVVGDLILLEMGDEIPADGRVIRANELYVDQSLLTGESEPVRKHTGDVEAGHDDPHDPANVFRGTQVIDGVGYMIVTNVGDDTLLGQIARKLAGEEEEAPSTQADTPEARVQRKLTISKQSTPLQEKLAVLAQIISRVGYAAAVAIFLALLVRGAFFAEPREVFLPQSTAEALTVVRHLLSYFVYMVIIIVVAVPEGLPMSVTVSLAVAWRKMSRANSLVRQLVACETIGSATVICSDKTGTLTQNRMQVARYGVGTQTWERRGSQTSGEGPSATQPTPPADVARRWLILNAAVNSTANLEERNGRPAVIGNTTEGALLLWLRDGVDGEGGPIDYRQLREQYPLIYQLHFSSERKRMTTVTQVDGRPVVFVKGAPEMLLEHSTHYQRADGSVHPLTAEVRQAIQEQLADAARQAMRTLAFAHADLPAHLAPDEDILHAHRDELEQHLIFDGWVAIRDPLREDVQEAVQRCRSAGIEVKMITGDTLETAKAIGREVGLLDSPDALALTHDEFARLSDEEALRILPRLRVLARALPGDKYRLVRLLQQQNHVVAMTGDGTNDAPALKKADVGLAMGLSGTEVAKEASKIVLLDDAFGTIVHGVLWGRALYENIQRFVQFQLTINVSALAIAFLGPFFGLRPPFTVLQLLWINVIMDTFAAIALCSEPPRWRLMEKPPKRRDESIVTREMLITIFGTATFFVVVMMTLLWGMKHYGWFASGSGPNYEPWDFAPLNVRQVTIFFTVYVFFQVWNQINCRSLDPAESGLYRLFDNPQFLLIASLTVIGQLLIVTFGDGIFHVEPLHWWDWLAIAAATATVLIFREVARHFRLWFRSPTTMLAVRPALPQRLP
jgi:Ca2+-transporting ATPase